MIQWTLYILLQYMYNICHYILTCTHAFLVSHRHRRYIRRGKCNYRYVYCIYVYDDYKNLWLCQCRQKSELRNLNSHDTKNTPFPDGGGVRSVQVVVFPFPPGFFQEALRFTFHKSRESRHFLLPLRRRGKSQPMRRSNRAGLDAVATNRFSGWNGGHGSHLRVLWKKLQQKMIFVIGNLIFFL